MSVRIALHGAKGRMGRRIAACAADVPEVSIVASFDRAAEGDTSNDSAGGEVEELLRAPTLPQALASGADVVIDFSSDLGTRSAVRLAERLRAALLVGTTGLTDATRSLLEEAERVVPVMVCANTSLGVAVVRRLVAEAARMLGPAYDVDIVETHHTRKLDAPSGTALALVASLREGGRDASPEWSRAHVHAIRAGDVIGDHLVQFATAGEVVRIQHTATDRELFARGALRAAQWLAGKPAGKYRIDDTFA